MTKALTVTRLEQLEKARAPASRVEIPDGLLPGLYLVLQPTGAKSWAVRYRHAGQPRKLTIGAYPALKLKDARDLGSKALRAAAEGLDPAKQKQAAKVEAKRQAVEEIRSQRDVIEHVAREFIKRYAVENTREISWVETARILGLKRKADGWVETGNGALAAWKGRRVQDISKRDVVVMLNAIVDRGARIMANRTLAALRKFFKWCVGQDIIETSPCSAIEAPAKENARDRILIDQKSNDHELRLVWQAAEGEGYPFGPVIQLMILLGQREGEIAEMRWRELDLDGRLWRMPGRRTKNAEPHTVPLPDAAIAIIKALPHVKSSGDFVFVSREGRPPTGFSHAKDRIDAAITAANGKPIAPWVFHDLRRSVASGMARLGIQLPTIEKILNHKSGSFRGIVGVYQHYDFDKEKRTALAAWASHVETLMSGKQLKNVVPLRPAKAESA